MPLTALPTLISAQAVHIQEKLVTLNEEQRMSTAPLAPAHLPQEAHVGDSKSLDRAELRVLEPSSASTVEWA